MKFIVTTVHFKMPLFSDKTLPTEITGGAGTHRSPGAYQVCRGRCAQPGPLFAESSVVSAHRKTAGVRVKAVTFHVAHRSWKRFPLLRCTCLPCLTSPSTSRSFTLRLPPAFTETRAHGVRAGGLLFSIPAFQSLASWSFHRQGAHIGSLHPLPLSHSFFTATEIRIKRKPWRGGIFKQHLDIFSNYLQLSKKNYTTSVLTSLKSKLKCLICVLVIIQWDWSRGHRQ